MSKKATRYNQECFDYPPRLVVIPDPAQFDLSQCGCQLNSEGQDNNWRGLLNTTGRCQYTSPPSSTLQNYVVSASLERINGVWWLHWKCFTPSGEITIWKGGKKGKDPEGQYMREAGSFIPERYFQVAAHQELLPDEIPLPPRILRTLVIPTHRIAVAGLECIEQGNYTLAGDKGIYSDIPSKRWTLQKSDDKRSWLIICNECFFLCPNPNQHVVPLIWQQAKPNEFPKGDYRLIDYPCAHCQTEAVKFKKATVSVL